MSPWQADATGQSDRFPRVSGDEPTYYTHHVRNTSFSPRERG